VTPEKLPLHLQLLHQTLTVLSNGFIVTGLRWGSMLAFLIDGPTRAAALYALSCALLTLGGLIHSVLPTGEIYLPWPIATHVHYLAAAGYLLLAGVLVSLRPSTC